MLQGVDFEELCWAGGSSAFSGRVAWIICFGVREISKVLALAERQGLHIEVRPYNNCLLGRSGREKKNLALGNLECG